jgi:2,4-dienoyl-CoA reductase-like NADH-dependent reductase (Old Yellow Enzyme family)
MKKVIAVDRRFNSLIRELEDRGYGVVDLFEQGASVDACIYYDGIRDFRNTGEVANSGVLMINGRGKTVDELEFILEKGTYSSLF